MKIKPVTIDIEDKRLFTQVAFLVDRPDFIQKVHEIRKEYKIDAKMQSTNYFKTVSDEELRQLQQRSDIYKVAAKIRQKFKYPPYFDDFIVQTILFNRVHAIRQTKTVTHLAKTITTPLSKPDLSENHLEMAIHITPLSTKKDVLKAFEETKQVSTEYEHTHQLSKVLDQDTLTNIERDRRWYWRVQKDNGYQKLINKLNNRPDTHISKDFHKNTQRCDLCYIDDDNYVHHAVSEYRKRLR